MAAPVRARLVAAALVLIAPTVGAQSVTAIVGATVIDGNGGAPLDRAVILIRDGRIEAVGREGEFAIPMG